MYKIGTLTCYQRPKKVRHKLAVVAGPASGQQRHLRAPFPSLLQQLHFLVGRQNLRAVGFQLLLRS